MNELRIAGLEDDVLQCQARIAELEGALKLLIEHGCSCATCYNRALAVAQPDTQKKGG